MQPHEPFSAPSAGTQLNRRHFLTRSVMASAAATLGTTAAQAQAVATGRAPAPRPQTPMPMGKLAHLNVSRLISGGNLISGWAHSRDLHYVPSLMRHYNTDEKVMDTLEALEQHGINTIIADPSERPFRVFGRYWKERGGRIQWIAEGHPREGDLKTNIQKSIDFGAKAVYVQGVIGDRWLRQKHLEWLGECVQLIKSNKVPGGIGAHLIDVIVEVEKMKLDADFYVKTCHHNKYWSARRPDQHQDVIDNATDNYWDMEPERTIAVMSEVNKPWIAFKVLAAGAIRPESGFRYAFENGADFICVGMFDFQVAANAQLASRIIHDTQQRERPWVA
jgi:hypothetical protein